MNKNSYHKFIKIGTIDEEGITYKNYTSKDLELCVKNSLLQNITNLNHIRLNIELFNNPTINKIIKDKYPYSYEYYLRAFSKNVDDTYREYHDLIKTHTLKNGETFREYFLNMDGVDLIIKKDLFGDYIADITQKTTYECDFKYYCNKTFEQDFDSDDYKIINPNINSDINDFLLSTIDKINSKLHNIKQISEKPDEEPEDLDEEP